MELYWIADLVFVLLGVLGIWRCARDGFIKCIFKLIRTALALVLAYFLITPVAPVIAENIVEEPVYDYVFEEVSEIYSETEANVDLSSLTENFPEFLLDEETTAKLDSLESTGDELVAAISEEISAPIVTLASNVLAFLVSFIVMFIVLSIILAVLNSLICKIKLINTVNTILGLIWGILITVIVMTVIAILLKAFSFGWDLYDSTYVIRFVGDTNIPAKLGLWDAIEKLLSLIIKL